MKLPEIDLDEPENAKEENFRQRLKYIDMHVEWMKRPGNISWSSDYKSIVNACSVPDSGSAEKARNDISESSQSAKKGTNDGEDVLVQTIPHITRSLCNMK